MLACRLASAYGRCFPAGQVGNKSRELRRSQDTAWGLPLWPFQGSFCRVQVNLLRTELEQQRQAPGFATTCSVARAFRASGLRAVPFANGDAGGFYGCFCSGSCSSQVSTPPHVSYGGIAVASTIKGGSRHCQEQLRLTNERVKKLEKALRQNNSHSILAREGHFPVQSFVFLCCGSPFELWVSLCLSPLSPCLFVCRSAGLSLCLCLSLSLSLPLSLSLSLFCSVLLQPSTYQATCLPIYVSVYTHLSICIFI